MSSSDYEQFCLTTTSKGTPRTDALAKLLIEKGVVTQHEYLQKISDERATYQAMLKPTPH
jgi:hypothetical protein